jgi:two-component system cell cycle response regulator
MKILIAEDDNMQRSILKVVLTRAGHEVVQTSDGQEAWDYLQKEHIRLVITDWMMPNMSGLDLVQHIRSASWSKYTYILLLTSLDLKVNIIEGLEAGADDYLTKPFDNNELKARMEIGERILDLESRLAYMATHDALTHLLNRRAIINTSSECLNHAATSGEPIGFVMADIDHFKAVNDTHGHLAGDQALEQFAEIISAVTPDTGFIGRWGGEEFLVVLPGAGLEGALKAAEKIRVSVADATLSLSNGINLKITCSLGASSSSVRDTPFELQTMIDQADKALYKAKSSGRNCVSS